MGIALAAVFAAGCGSLNRVDLRLQSIEVVARADQPLPNARGDWDTLPGRVARVTFQADANLRAARNAKHLHVSFEAWFCGQEKLRLSHFSFVYDDVGVLGEDTSPPATSNSVWVYLDERADDRRDIETQQAVPGYDLKQGAKDVCVQIRARDMMLAGFTSNVVRVPAALLADALK